ncbi:M4 family metallopeptidase [Nocardioides sp. Bht2]|uniref:M4 family metallopeptidase n=1 Tax=Nocardioides sp. Bht2 TaxID=3392297 RepID=UPI0039B656F4
MRVISAAAVLGLAASLGVVGVAGPTQAQQDRPGALAALDAHPALARDAAGQGFERRAQIRDANGRTHVRFERTYRGLPVIGGDLVVHQSADGDLSGVNQTLRAPLSLATKARVARGVAERKATGSRFQRAIRKAEVTGTAQLVVDATAAKPVLAWEVVTSGVQRDGTPSRLATYVDATSGTVLRAVQQIHNVDGQGTGLYSGSVPVEISTSGSGYVLTDPDRGNSSTVDAQNKTDGLLCNLLGLGCAKGVAFASTDTSYGTGTSASRESAAVDAHYGAAQTWDYFAQVHGRQGIFGNGKGAVSRVHYGNGYVNAFWDGEKMTYGDGDGTNYGPLVSLDVAGHEMSHGVTENTANLTYSGESGGLNEATSDIFGTMVEFHAANTNDPGDYLIGEEFDLADGSGLRRMDDPASDGKSVGCWTSTTKNLDVHYSSGVGNHFFYLLAEGSGAKTVGGKAHNSPTCNGSSLAGIGRAAAADIWFRALTVYFTSGTTYAQARTATLQSATDLYGPSSPQRAAVAAAWSAVGVN